MILGDKVSCTAYIKKSGNGYQKSYKSNGIPECLYYNHATKEVTEVEEEHSCDRYVKKDKVFNGVFVGTVTLCTKITAIYETYEYGDDYFATGCDTPQTFAVVYYGNNKKRVVPLDCIQPITPRMNRKGMDDKWQT